MPTQEQKEELRKVIPPSDVVVEIGNILMLYDISKEKVKSAFYKALVLDSLDEFTDIDERCRQALRIVVDQLHKKQKNNILEQAGFSEQVKNMEQGLCAFCGKPVNVEDFRDAPSRKEFCISGLCQKCQDGVFGKR